MSSCAAAARPHADVTALGRRLMHTVGVLNPSDPRTADVVSEIGKQMKAMPPHRIFRSDIEVLGRATLLSGILCRVQGYDKDAPTPYERAACVPAPSPAASPATDFPLATVALRFIEFC